MTNAIEKRAARAGWLRATLLIVWFLVSFAVAFFARDLDMVVAGWPLNFWLTAQGAVLVFIAVVAVYAAYMNRVDADPVAVPPPAEPDAETEAEHAAR